MVSPNNKLLRREKATYAKILIEHESLFALADQNPGLTSREVERIRDASDRFDRMLLGQRGRIRKAGGHVIDTAFIKHIEPLSPEAIAEDVSKIQLTLASHFDQSVEFDVHRLDNESGLYEFSLFTDKRILVPAIGLINSITNHAYNFSPFEKIDIAAQHQRVPGLLTLEDGIAYLEEFAKDVGVNHQMPDGYDYT